tara:strand:+ start:474 stop:887 length:414 start_codon:yes stop_codon:yes gene_type:complete
MPFYAIDPDDTIEVYLKEDGKVAKSKRALFYLKTLTVIEATKLQIFLVNFHKQLEKQEVEEDQDGDESILVMSNFINSIEKHAFVCIKSWKNLKTQKGKIVKFTKEKIMTVLPLDAILELLTQALKRGNLSEGDEGN